MGSDAGGPARRTHGGKAPCLCERPAEARQPGRGRSRTQRCADRRRPPTASTRLRPFGYGTARRVDAGAICFQTRRRSSRRAGRPMPSAPGRRGSRPRRHVSTSRVTHRRIVWPRISAGALGRFAATGPDHRSPYSAGSVPCGTMPSERRSRRKHEETRAGVVHPRQAAQRQRAQLGHHGVTRRCVCAAGQGVGARIIPPSASLPGMIHVSGTHHLPPSVRIVANDDLQIHQRDMCWT